MAVRSSFACIPTPAAISCRFWWSRGWWVWSRSRAWWSRNWREGVKQLKRSIATVHVEGNHGNWFSQIQVLCCLIAHCHQVSDASPVAVRIDWYNKCCDETGGVLLQALIVKLTVNDHFVPLICSCVHKLVSLLHHAAKFIRALSIVKGWSFPKTVLVQTVPWPAMATREHAAVQRILVSCLRIFVLTRGWTSSIAVARNARFTAATMVDASGSGTIHAV